MGGMLKSSISPLFYIFYVCYVIFKDSALSDWTCMYNE